MSLSDQGYFNNVMLENILNLNGISVLSKQEQRNVNGGINGGCAVLMTNGDGERLVFHGTKAEITEAGGNGGGNRWCCESCGSATWINSCNVC